MHYEFGDFVFDAERLRLRKNDGGETSLTGKPSDALLYLLDHPGQALDKNTLLAAIWPGVVVEEKSLTQVISTLRQTLGEIRGENRYIVTLPRKGYRCIAPVRRGSRHRRADWRPTVRSGIDRCTRQAPVDADVCNRCIGDSGGWRLAFGTGGLRPPLVADIHSLAILPFKPLIATERDPALELGMADTLIGQLAQGGQAISPLSSVRRFDRLNQDPVDAGRPLHVDAVLDGSIQRQGERLRISVRLLRVADSKQLWSESFDRTFTGIFAVQDAIARRIVTALAYKAAALGDKTAAGTRDARAYKSYAAGRFASMRLTHASLTQAMALYGQAVAEDPNYALAYAGLADCLRS